jgi:catechol 2,3-dioxygenase-like lactoylglutathione lyase family enzyme
MTALWLPFTVPELAPGLALYRDRLGLPVVDGWSRDGEEGVVLAAGQAFVELVSPVRPQARSLLAFEVDDVEAAYARFGSPGAPPRRFPRGHTGFEVAGPAGATVLVWSER